MSDINTHPLDNILFIMHKPSHPGNVGAAARALKTMGFGRLALVAPKLSDVLQHPDALALASGATDVLANSQLFDTLADALANTTLAFALTARPRDLGPPSSDIRQAAHACHQHLGLPGQRQVALVFGTERTGLNNADIALCHQICHIPANPDYSSLNVAQALQLVAWELRYALLATDQGLALPDTHKASVAPGSLPASHQQVQALLQHLETAAVAIGFLDPEHPKKLMLRLQHLLTRCELSRDESDMLRGLCTAMLKTAARAQDS